VAVVGVLQSFQWMSRVLQAVDTIHQVGIYCLALVPPNYLPKVRTVHSVPFPRCIRMMSCIIIDEAGLRFAWECGNRQPNPKTLFLYHIERLLSIDTFWFVMTSLCR